MRQEPVPARHGLIGALVPGYGVVDVPSLSEVAESTLFSGADGVGPFDSSLIATASWADLDDAKTAADLIVDSVSSFDIGELIAFNDVVLAAPIALPELAVGLEGAWRAISETDASTRGNVALEAWTRLALGGWTSSNLVLRAALGERCNHAAQASAAADVFLVRTVGAALDEWGDQELVAALGRLAEIDDVECNVAFELGMVHLRVAVEADVPHDAARSLDEAFSMFDLANAEDDRPDAVAFKTACAAVAAFLRSEPLPAGAASGISTAVRDWYAGYLGEVPHWRQARAQVGGAWGSLVADLERIDELDSDAWLDAGGLLSDVARVYVSHHSSTLIADPTAWPFTAADHVELAMGQAREGVAVAIGPRLDAALAARAERVKLVDRWLETVSETVPDLDAVARDALAAARQRIREAPPPGKLDASRGAGLPDTVREALVDQLDPSTLGQVVDLIDSLGTEVGLQPDRSLAAAEAGLREHLVLKRLHEQVAAIAPAEHREWSGSLNVVLKALVRVTATAIDREQGSERRLPWHGDVDEGRRPREALLADYLAQTLQVLTGIHVHVEIPNIAGGRADVVIPVSAEEFVIEVKREETLRTDEELTVAYADQAAQYTHTRTPFAMLAVLDLVRRPARLGLDGSFWVSRWSDGTVERALVGVRVLASVATPSSLS